MTNIVLIDQFLTFVYRIKRSQPAKPGVPITDNTTMLKPTLIVLMLVAGFCGCQERSSAKIETTMPGEISLSTAELQDKIKGGWAGQTIGVTFGGPYEFRFNGTFIGDYQKLFWADTLIRHNMQNNPGLYDDLYMDLTFVDVFEKIGFDAPLDSFANAYANAGYMLWHANQAGRYNILHGLKAPQSGFWKNNPHADCIDYQIESDFAGLMSPGMPNTASKISDGIGHIMNYGDGWYGGVFVGSMYAIAFTSDDINYIINEALKTIPQQSNFHQCISDVVKWHQEYPNDWKATWFEVQKKWANDISCPDGVFRPFNIDATINAAYVTMGLLYGNKDFSRSLEIATRCGQDADCNPSTVAGVLGTIVGYQNIPEYWRQSLKFAEDIDFKYTTMSLNDVYDVGLKHALENIRRNGGNVTGDKVMIKAQRPVAVPFEKSFDGMYPVERIPVSWSAAKDEITFSYTGTGFVLMGSSADYDERSSQNRALQTELYVDDQLVEKPELPVDFITRRHELAWRYDMPKGVHRIKLKILTPSGGKQLSNVAALYYTDTPVIGFAEDRQQ